MRFLIDADDVLADFYHPAIEVISQVLGKPWVKENAPLDWDMFRGLTKDQLQEVDAIIDTPGWCSRLEPCPGAQEAIKTLRHLCEVFVVTSPRRQARQWAFERTLWLNQHFGFQKSHIVFTSAKHICSGDFFLDDRPENVLDWQVSNFIGLGMLWNTEHNERLTGYDSMRIRSWKTVFDRVQKYALWCTFYIASDTSADR